MKRRYFFIGLGILLLTFLVSRNTFAGSILAWDQSAEVVTGYRVYYSQVSGEYTNYVEITTNSYALSSLPLTEGVTYYLIVRAYNAAGESENSNEITYTAPDNTPPAQPQGLSANNQAGSLSWQANTETDLKEYRVYFGKSAGSYNPFIPVGKTTGYTFSGLEPGIQYFCAVSAVDQSGNESGYSSTVMLTAPSGVGSSTISSGSGPVLSWTQSGGIVLGYRIYYGTIPDSYPDRWDAGNTTQVALSVLPLEEGKTYYFVVRAYNDSGESVNSEAVTWTTVLSVKDTEKPTILIQAPATSGTYDTTVSTINLSGTASDNEGITEVSWNNSRGGNGLALGTTTWSISGISLSEGENLLTITATDAAGNAGTQVVSVIYRLPDTTVPQIVIISPANASTYETDKPSISLAGSATDNVGVVRVSWQNVTGFDSGVGGDASGTTNWSTPSISLTEGDNTIIIAALDKAGNKGTATLKVKYTLPDTVKPEIRVQTPVFGSTARYETELQTITISGVASDNSGAIQQVKWSNSRGGSGIAAGTATWSISGVSLAEGDNILTITASDAAGNAGIQVVTVFYRIPIITPPPSTDLVITNLTAVSGKSYRIKQGLNNGSTCYIDRTYVYSEVPSYLLQSTYIQTANSDKLRTESAFLSFTVNIPVTVYVAFDDRYAIPSWLSGFTNTGNKLKTESLMKILKKDYTAGKITLGGNGNAGNQYTVMVVKKPVVVNLTISNLKAASGKIYPVKTALSNGSTCYIDRSYVYSEIPSYLLKSMFIQTANDDKLRTDSTFLSFDINIPATVYIAFDDRYPIPSWLSGFTNTGNKLKTESLMKILKKDYNAGKVNLGGNGHSGNQYTVMTVKK